MPSTFNRRSFLRRASLATAAASAAQLFPFPSVLHAATRGSGSNLRCALIGCGGRGLDHVGTLLGERFIALVDADETRQAVVRKAVEGTGGNAEQIQAFTDYRRLFDKLGKQLDAVFIAAPNHHHYLSSMIAMQLGIGVFCEKPLCHDIAEGRRMAAMAARCKSPTQMGNQGHCEEGYMRLCECIWAGLVGPIRETHSWCDRSNGGAGPRPPVLPVPTGMHWDEWIGPAPYRDFHSDLHLHEWHGWYDFGNGSLGNMGCHIIDGICWALKLEHPASVEAESISGGSDERYPIGDRIRWDFPARGNLPALTAYWYDGFLPGSVAAEGKSRPRYLPPLLARMKREYPQQKFEPNGTLYVGEKGILYTGCYGRGAALLGKGVLVDKRKPDTFGVSETLRRPGTIAEDFLRACREGKRDTAAEFGYGSRLTEILLIGNLAQHAGPNKLVQWDGPQMKVTNIPELNAWIDRPYREGWKL